MSLDESSYLRRGDCFNLDGLNTVFIQTLPWFVIQNAHLFLVPSLLSPLPLYLPTQDQKNIRSENRKEEKMRIILVQV